MRIQEQAFRVYTDQEHFEQVIRFYEGFRTSRAKGASGFPKPASRPRR
jgi:hypothetical protein